MRSADPRMKLMSRQEALEKLVSVAVGRLHFNHHGLPGIQFVNHIFDDGQIIIRGHAGHIATLVGSDNTWLIGYETAEIDPASLTGWSVTVTGPAELVTDPRKLDGYRAAFAPCADGDGNSDGHGDHILSIRPQLVAGYEIVRGSRDGTRLTGTRLG
jgi:hypothetical protein